MKIAKIDAVSATETFQVNAGALRVTDPCYSDMETWCAGTLDNVLNGTWEAHVGYHDDVQGWGRRCAFVHIVAQGYERHFDHSTELDSTWQLADIDVGVDSGQAGFFDVAKFARTVAQKESNDAFYDSVCNLTLEDKSFGTIDFGCVSSSGYGDGAYDCYYRRNDVGQLIEAVIVFIGEYDDDEELAA